MLSLCCNSQHDCGSPPNVIWTCLESLGGVWTMPEVDYDLACLWLEKQSIGQAPESFL